MILLFWTTGSTSSRWMSWRRLPEKSADAVTASGADGILALADPREAEADYRMIYHNADGSEGTMCGNGARCIARYAHTAGFAKENICMETASGLYRALVPEDVAAGVQIEFEWPRHWRPSVQLETQLPALIEATHFLWPGTEHLVCMTPSLDDIDVDLWGAAFRADPALMPAGANVNFVEVRDSSTLKVRTYEKGVEAQTQACGTGAVASAVAALWAGHTRAERMAIEMPGGRLNVGLDKDRLYLEGPAGVIYRGSFEVSLTDLAL